MWPPVGDGLWCGRTHALVDVQLEFLLGDALLDPLAEGGVSSGAAAALPVLDQAAALAVERRSRRAIMAVLLRAEAIHAARLLVTTADPSEVSEPGSGPVRLSLSLSLPLSFTLRPFVKDDPAT